MKQKKQPLDGILNFNEQPHEVSKKVNLTLDKVIQFDSLPISGWHDSHDAIDSKCSRSCVKDCSCVSHCAFIVT
ncbi:MAG: hypothetical protein AABY49_00150 [Planctomycetota bacterium]